MSINKLVSIIIPVYNVEKYLDKSVKSAIEQTYKKLEIILVDDGSKDSSGEMCDRWKARDSRILVIHKKNGGLSSARNAALDMCNGEYVYFLDGDDYIEKNTIEILMNDICETRAQIAQAPFIHIYENNTYVRDGLKERTVMNTAEAIQYNLSAFGGGTVSSCSKLFSRDIFSDYRFAEGKLNEDHYSIVDLLSRAKLIAAEPKPLYNYVHRKNSITTASFSAKSMDDIDAAKRNYELIKENYPEAIDVALFRIDLSTLRVIDKIMLAENFSDKALLNKLVKQVRRNKARILRSPYFTRKRKLSILILLTNKALYRHFVRENAKQSWSD